MGLSSKEQNLYDVAHTLVSIISSTFSDERAGQMSKQTYSTRDEDKDVQ
jgi:hypothetical protein